MPRPIERCCLCNEPTGKAGKCEDSIYIDLPYAELGPLCEICMHGLEEWCAENTGMEAENAALRADLVRLKVELGNMKVSLAEYQEYLRVAHKAEDIYKADLENALNGGPCIQCHIKQVEALRAELAEANKLIQHFATFGCQTEQEVKDRIEAARKNLHRQNSAQNNQES